MSSQRHLNGSIGGWAGGHDQPGFDQVDVGIITGLGKGGAVRRNGGYRYRPGDGRGKGCAGEIMQAGERRRRSLVSVLHLDQNHLIRINYLTDLLLLSGGIRETTYRTKCTLKEMGNKYNSRLNKTNLQWK